ncbi:cobalt/magnesium transport protein CorA [Abditibacteriota bacterium]|nr:cobalt/magnesium transport protein CorA [Abditibacteriota bacterium]
MDAKLAFVFQGIFYDAAKNTVEVMDRAELHKVALKSDHTPCHPLGDEHSFMWIDITKPSDEKLKTLSDRFKLDPQILEDLQEREGRPKLHDYDEYLYLIFHAITLDDDPDHPGKHEVNTHEIDCLVGGDWLVTIHDAPIPKFDTLAARWKRRPEWMKNGAGNLLYELMDSILDDYFPILDRLDEKIDSFEDRLYGAGESAEENGDDSGDGRLSSEIFALKRALLEIRHIAGPTRDVANILLRRDAEEGGKHFAAFQDLYDHASRIVENIDTYRDILSGALDAYLAIESNRMNAVMKRLTAYSIILLLPTLIAGIYGMNFDDLPKEHGFWGSLGAMGVIVMGLFAYFKWLKWL